MGATLEFVADPAAFLAAVGRHLALAPVVSTVVATVAERMARDAAAGLPVPEEDWYLVVRDETGSVAGAGMCTAPFEPRPLYLLPMPDEAAVMLARILHARGEQVRAVFGALPAVRLVAEETARLTGGAVEVGQHTRLFELRDLVEARPVPGRLRPATAEDVERASAWFEAFMRDADEQAGRTPGVSPHEVPDRAGMLRRIAEGRVWFWEDAEGRPVHLTGANPVSFGVARIGPVYTPKEERGRGWASAAVAQVARRILEAGARPCLFTDQANPTSNRIYRALGFRPVVDMANLWIR